MSIHPAPPLLLASSSPYRRDRLAGLGIAFDHAAPAIDESPLPEETASDLVARLARQKAVALAAQYPGHLIIGSDQVAVTEEGQVLTKPGNLARAHQQLTRCSGRTTRFLTGLCLHDAARNRQFTAVEPYDVVFRSLSASTISRYLEAEQPLDCAGSFKMEGLGVILFERLDGRDPNALIGLPLMALEDGLQHFGLSLLAYRT